MTEHTTATNAGPGEALTEAERSHLLRTCSQEDAAVLVAAVERILADRYLNATSTSTVQVAGTGEPLTDEQLDALEGRLTNASKDRLQAIVDNPDLSDDDWIRTRRADMREALAPLLADRRAAEGDLRARIEALHQPVPDDEGRPGVFWCSCTELVEYDDCPTVAALAQPTTDGGTR